MENIFQLFICAVSTSVFTAYLHSNHGDLSCKKKLNIFSVISTVVYLVSNSAGVF